MSADCKTLGKENIMNRELLHPLFEGSALGFEKSFPKHFLASESNWLALGFGHCYFEIFCELVVGGQFQQGNASG